MNSNLIPRENGWYVFDIKNRLVTVSSIDTEIIQGPLEPCEFLGVLLKTQNSYMRDFSKTQRATNIGF